MGGKIKKMALFTINRISVYALLNYDHMFTLLQDIWTSVTNFTERYLFMTLFPL
jgi:hypothetical protein